MKKHLVSLVLLVVALSAHADETFTTLTIGNDTYSNVTVTVVTATDIYFTYNGGMGNAKIKNLSPQLRQHFHFNRANAAAVEQKQAKANAQYLVRISGQPDAYPTDESRQPQPVGAPQSSVQWITDFPTALNEARSNNKRVLLDFTGSDWCPWCMKFDREALSTSQFADYAQNKLILVKVDFPNNVPQSEELRQANKNLAARYNVSGYPTLLLVDESGKELGRQVGYAPGGADAFTAELDGWSYK